MCFGSKKQQQSVQTNPAPYSLDNSHTAVTQTVESNKKPAEAPDAVDPSVKTAQPLNPTAPAPIGGAGTRPNIRM